MLILTRYTGQRCHLYLGGTLLGSVQIVDGGHTRLGFDMPGVRIVRDNATVKVPADGKPTIGAFPAIELPQRGEGYQS